MKKAIAVLSLISIIILSCGTSSDNYKHSAPDSVTTVTLYANRAGVLSLDWTVRITQDSFRVLDADTSKDAIVQKRSWGRVTTYYIPILDSIRGKDGKPLADSLNKFQKELIWIPHDTKFIVKDFEFTRPFTLKK